MAFVLPSPMRIVTPPSQRAAIQRRPRQYPQPPKAQTSSPGASNSANSTNGTAKSSSQTPTSPYQDPIPAQTRPVPTSDLKTELYQTAVSTNRGLSATPYQRDQILNIIAQLEQVSPPTAPVDDPRLLTGRWKLLFTDSLDVLSLGLLAPFALVGDVFQNIFEANVEESKGYDYEIFNVVKLQPPFAPVANAFFGETVAELKVTAEGKRVSDIRIDLTFVKSALKQEKIVGRDVPWELPPLSIGFRSRVGAINTTFLDADLRVARTISSSSEKNVFVLLRE